MSGFISSVKKRLFGLSEQEVTFAHRGFSCDNDVARAHLETAGKAFVTGYNAALEHAVGPQLDRKLAAVTRALTGFAFEGAAMALSIQDWLTPWNRNRVSQFLNGSGAAHSYMIHVGAGWTIARLPRNVPRFVSKFDPLLRWLLIDGYGFHEGFFKLTKNRCELPHPKKIDGYARQVFDQGLGRSVWFVEGASIQKIVDRIATFASTRHADLWSGVGLASAYAGEVSQAELEFLRQACGVFLPQVAQGAAFAAKARQRAGNLLPYQHMACGLLCEMDADRAAALTDEQLENLPADGAVPAYEIWRARIQQHFRKYLEVQA